MPPWREQLRPASFRGVAFQVSSHEAEGFARRAQVHEYPKREDAFPEDLGAQTRGFGLEGYVIGPDYFAARDALLAACGRPGPGTLVHPYLGTHEVVCTQCRPRESTRNGGMATFRLRFVRAGTNQFPAERPDTGKLVSDAATSADATLLEAFEDLFSTADGPQWLIDEAAALIQDVTTALRKASTLIADLSGGDPAAYTRDLSILETTAAVLAEDPDALGTSVLARIQDLADLAGDATAGIEALEQLAGWGSDLPAVITSTPTRIQQEQNQDALVRLVRQSAAIRAATRATEVTLTSYGEAVALRDRITALIDAEIDALGSSGGSDASMRALIEVLVATVRDLNARGAQLARINSFTPPGTDTALRLAYQLYGDASRSDEIVARNGIRHPGFVAGGTALEVLSA